VQGGRQAGMQHPESADCSSTHGAEPRQAGRQAVRWQAGTQVAGRHPAGNGGGTQAVRTTGRQAGRHPPRQVAGGRWQADPVGRTAEPRKSRQRQVNPESQDQAGRCRNPGPRTQDARTSQDPGPVGGGIQEVPRNDQEQVEPPPIRPRERWQAGRQAGSMAGRQAGRQVAETQVQAGRQATQVENPGRQCNPGPRQQKPELHPGRCCRQAEPSSSQKSRGNAGRCRNQAGAGRQATSQNPGGRPTQW